LPRSPDDAEILDVLGVTLNLLIEPSDPGIAALVDEAWRGDPPSDGAESDRHLAPGASLPAWPTVGLLGGQQILLGLHEHHPTPAAYSRRVDDDRDPSVETPDRTGRASPNKSMFDRTADQDLELWRHFAGFGGEDKNRMVTVTSWLLGFSYTLTFSHRVGR
jgi:hypothetical protein